MRNSIFAWLRDWWRGYSDADIESVARKMRETPKVPGAVIYVTERESIAMARENVKIGGR